MQPQHSSCRLLLTKQLSATCIIVSLGAACLSADLQAGPSACIFLAEDFTSRNLGSSWTSQFTIEVADRLMITDGISTLTFKPHCANGPLFEAADRCMFGLFLSQVDPYCPRYLN